MKLSGIILKKYSLFFLLLFPVQSLMSQEEASTKLYNGLYLNVLPLLTKTLQLTYERELLNENSFVICPKYTYVNKNIDNYETYKGRGSGIELQYRINLSKQLEKKAIKDYDKYFKPLVKSYFSPFVTYDYVGATCTNDGYEYDIYTDEFIYIYNTENISISSFSAGIVFGLKFPVTQQLFFDTYLGAGFRDSKYHGDYLYEMFSSWFRPGYSGIFLKTGIQIGFIF